MNRFRTAQDGPTGFAQALAELLEGQKRSHWIWYIFPQLAGLGHSPMAEHFALKDAADAREYLEDAVLAARLEEITKVVHDQLERGIRLDVLMGAEIDAMKLVSSLTLFEAVARQPGGDSGLAKAATAVLDRAGRDGFPRCAYTLARLRQG